MKPEMRGPRRYARFLLAYRLEVSDGPEDAPAGRGWVVRVPDDAEPILAERARPRWFNTLTDVPAVLDALLDEAGPGAGQRGSGSE